VDEWCERRRIARGEVVAAAQCFELGRRWYAGRLEREWRRSSVEEMEAKFLAVGLTSGFWRMR
jgi:hypothetical protein